MMAKDKRVDEDRCCKEEIVTANPCKLVERNPEQRQFGFGQDTIATRDLAAGHHARHRFGCACSQGGNDTARRFFAANFFFTSNHSDFFLWEGDASRIMAMHKIY